jgi:predicted nucleotidyltransferase
MTKQSILENLKRLRPVVRDRYRADIKGFFGSYARGEQDTDSDMLVDFDSDADLFDFVGLSDFLEEMLSCSIDVVPIRSIREEIKVQILSEAIYI